jgi:hypothetical protein
LTIEEVKCDVWVYGKKDSVHFLTPKHAAVITKSTFLEDRMQYSEMKDSDESNNFGI